MQEHNNASLLNNRADLVKDLRSSYRSLLFVNCSQFLSSSWPIMVPRVRTGRTSISRSGREVEWNHTQRWTGGNISDKTPGLHLASEQKTRRPVSTSRIHEMSARPACR